VIAITYGTAATDDEHGAVAIRARHETRSVPDAGCRAAREDAMELQR
jgi:hypothetical protein